MSRSMKKGPFVSYKLIKKIDFLKKNNISEYCLKLYMCLFSVIYFLFF